MKRGRSEDLMNERTAVQKLPPTFVPSRAIFKKDPRDPRILEYLVNILALTKNITEPSHEFMQSTVDRCKWLNPFHYELNGVSWNAASGLPALHHYPIASFGKEDVNHSFCRVSTQASDLDTVYVTFRPFILEDLHMLVKQRGIMSTLYRHYAGVPRANYSRKVIDNLLSILHALQTTAIQPGNLVHDGYIRLLMQEKTCVTLENKFLFVPMDAGRRVRLIRELRSMGLSNVFDETIVPAIAPGLGRILKAYAPKRVVFSGFSLGGGSSLAAAVLIHQDFVRSGTPLPEFHSVSVSGTMVGGKDLSDYVDRNFASTMYIATKGKRQNGRELYDPVSAMPYAPAMRHVGHQLLIEYADHTIKLVKTPFRGKAQSALAWTSLVVRQLLPGTPLGGGGGVVEAFDKIHMIGEDMVLRIVLLKLLLSGYRSPLLNHLTCAFFTSTGSAAKYQICPRDCDLITKVQTTTRGKAKKLHVCVRKKRQS